MNEIIYFELNNWFSGRDYPNAEPFTTWMTDANLRKYFLNDEWVKENKLIVVTSMVDMSINFCITALREWVEKNCPKLLSDENTSSIVIRGSGENAEEIKKTFPYKKFLREPDKYGDVAGRFGHQFLPYIEENIGIHWTDDDE